MPSAQQSTAMTSHACSLSVVQLCKAAGDPLRANILRLLAHDSFGVLELCSIFDMAQPAMSHHLKCLAEAGLVQKRPEGTFVFYQRARPESEFVQSLFAGLDAEYDNQMDSSVAAIYKTRAERSIAFFESHADALHQQQTRVCHADVYRQAVLNTIQRLPETSRSKALEVGPGDGSLLQDLSRLFSKAEGIDTSATTLKAAEVATGNCQNVKLTHADFMKIPPVRRANAIVATMVIHHIASPQAFFFQAGNHLRNGGLLVVAELIQHEQRWVTEACGDIWLGFTPAQLIQWSDDAGFEHLDQQILAQRNGFTVQVHAFQLLQPEQSTGPPPPPGTKKRRT
ncbi:MAG: metalloregulator ArsR/SmtB family transcription factor [Pseudomonadota bacterium]